MSDNPADVLLKRMGELQQYADDLGTPDEPIVQTIEELLELTFSLLNQHQELLSLMDAVIAEHRKGAAATKLILADMQDMKAAAKGLPLGYTGK